VQPCGAHRQPRRDLASSPCSKPETLRKPGDFCAPPHRQILIRFDSIVGAIPMASEETVRDRPHTGCHLAMSIAGLRVRSFIRLATERNGRHRGDVGAVVLKANDRRLQAWLLRAYVIARDPVRIVAETSEYARATFCESGKFKRQIGVMGLADLCLAPEGQTGNPAVAELETHHAELQSRTHPNYAGGP